MRRCRPSSSRSSVRGPRAGRRRRAAAPLDRRRVDRRDRGADPTAGAAGVGARRRPGASAPAGGDDDLTRLYRGRPRRSSSSSRRCRRGPRGNHRERPQRPRPRHPPRRDGFARRRRPGPSGDHARRGHRRRGADRRVRRGARAPADRRGARRLAGRDRKRDRVGGDGGADGSRPVAGHRGPARRAAHQPHVRDLDPRQRHPSGPRPAARAPAGRAAPPDGRLLDAEPARLARRRRARAPRPDRRVVLTGPGGGSWLVPLAADGSRGSRTPTWRSRSTSSTGATGWASG